MIRFRPRHGAVRRMKPIYLDYSATTPVDPRVADAIDRAMKELWGNPSSSHVHGKAAHAAVETARAQVAALIGAEPDEIVFTGGGSEASNLALKGSCLRPRPTFSWRNLTNWLLHGNQHVSDHAVIVSAVEHPATAVPAEFLRRLGATVRVLPVDRFGQIDPADVGRAVLGEWTGRTAVVSLMHSNNEVGTLMPVAEVGDLRQKRRFVFHTDCAQSLGKVPVDVNELGVDLLTIAGHKLYAPKGVGALYVRRGTPLEPLIHGAGHEAGRRAGTENVPYLVGLGVAAELARLSLPAETERLRGLRDRLHERLITRLGERLTLNGHPTERLPNTLNVSVGGCVGSDLLAKVPGVAASTGSACHEGKVSQSPVLAAMRVPPDVGKGAVRLSVGRWTTEAEVDEAAELLADAAG